MEPRLTLKTARDLLGVQPGCDGRSLRRAWAVALKACADDAERTRAVVAAYRVLRAPSSDSMTFAPMAPRGRTEEHIVELRLTTAQAAAGGWRTVRLGERTLRLRVPPAAINGMRLRLRAGRPNEDLIVVLRTPRPAPKVAEALRRRFELAWAA